MKNTIKIAKNLNVGHCSFRLSGSLKSRCFLLDFKETLLLHPHSFICICPQFNRLKASFSVWRGCSDSISRFAFSTSSFYFSFALSFVRRLLGEPHSCHMFFSTPRRVDALSPGFSFITAFVCSFTNIANVPCKITPWNSMEFYGSPMEFHGSSMEFHGASWKLHGVPWGSMETTRTFVEFHRSSMETHGVRWILMEYWWSSMEAYWISLCDTRNS